MNLIKVINKNWKNLKEIDKRYLLENLNEWILLKGSVFFFEENKGFFGNF